MSELNPIDMSMSQIVRCRYVPYGCPWMVQYQLGEQAESLEQRRVHQENCQFRFHERPAP